MIISMTGFGRATSSDGDALFVSVEIRAVNNRYLKINTKSPEPYNAFEPEVEKLIRKRIRRGTIQTTVRVQNPAKPEDYRLNLPALESYSQQLESFATKTTRGFNLGELLDLPGVILENYDGTFDPMDHWETAKEAIELALDSLVAMRSREGEAMQVELTNLCEVIASKLKVIEQRTPELVESYRNRLLDRVKTLLSEVEAEVDPTDLIKEVSIFAERSDITEELVRLDSHLQQFRGLLNGESNGRKLDFLTQEMFREANTVCSKACDVQISQHAVEVKGDIEKIREIVQNIE